MKKIMFNEPYGLQDAVLKGRKTMTRRAVSQRLMYANLMQMTLKDYLLLHAPYQLDDIVAIAQSYEALANSGYEQLGKMIDEHHNIKKEYTGAGWNNKMFVMAELMPHHIRITDVKIEHLQNISNNDCLKEGVYEDYEEHGGIYTTEFYDYIGNKGDGFGTPFEAFASLIDAISGKGTWERNPLVYAYEFELID